MTATIGSIGGEPTTMRANALDDASGMKLFAILIGGEHPGANIELHDLRFVVAPSLAATYPELRRQWWGKRGSLHIDCWAEIDHADGHDVTLSAEPFAGTERLWFVNLGGYDPGEFGEQHKYVFVVAASAARAKTRALRLAKGWSDLHRDDLYEAEQIFALSEAAAPHRLHVHLTPSAVSRDLAFTCGYTPIRRV